MSETERTSTNWPRALLALAVVLIAHGVLFRDTFGAIVATWYGNETYAHGFLIFPIALYMAWTRRGTLARHDPGPDFLALAPLAALVFLWLAGALADVLVVQEFAVVMLVSVVVWAMLGRHVAWLLIYPLAYLFFAVPVGEFAVEPMMDYTAVFTIWALKATGIPVFAEGRYITIPSGQWEVAEACSGVRYLIASVALGVLYAYISYRSIWKRLAFIALAFAFPVVANWLRAYGIVMLGHLSDMKLATGVDHIIYGWFFFGIVMLLLFWVGSWWQDPDPEAPRDADAGGTMKGARERGSIGVQTLLVLLVLAAGSAALAFIQDRAVEASTVTLPTPAAGWQAPEQPETEWGGVYPGAAIMARWPFVRDDERVDLYLVRYDAERQGEELIAWGNRLLDDQAWQFIRTAKRSVTAADGLTVRETLYRGRGGAYRLVWQWYVVAGHPTTSPQVGKALSVWGKLSGLDQGGTLMALATDFFSRPEDGAAVLQRFIGDNHHLVQPGNLLHEPGR